MQRLERDNIATTEKLQMLESSLSLSENERKVLQDKIRDLQEMESRLRDGNNTLRNEIEAASGVRAKLELKITALSGELQRMKKVCEDTDTENRELRERLSVTMRDKQVNIPLLLASFIFFIAYGHLVLF